MNLSTNMVVDSLLIALRKGSTLTEEGCSVLHKNFGL